MIKIEFSEEEIAQIRHERYRHPHPRIQPKMEALLLKSERLPHADITRIVGICENTLRSYLKDYQEQGIEKLKEINFYRPSSELEAYRGTLHFVLSPFLGFLWSMARYFIKAPCGRQRFNILGALNAFTHELIMVTNDTILNAESVCELLRRVAATSLIVPITLILDNAKYQKCAIVREMALDLEIELLYLPTYSPNLNLIERLWKYVKNQCLYSKYHKDFNDFKSVIMSCLEQTTTIHKQSLDSLLSLNFQSFTKAQFMTE
jgi:transposase